MLANPTHAKIADLEAKHPGWLVWVVTRTHGGSVWLARNFDTGVTVEAASPELLDERLGKLADS
jgi:hypothetical protein